MKSTSPKEQNFKSTQHKKTKSSKGIVEKAQSQQTRQAEATAPRDKRRKLSSPSRTLDIKAELQSKVKAEHPRQSEKKNASQQQAQTQKGDSLPSISNKNYDQKDTPLWRSQTRSESRKRAGEEINGVPGKPQSRLHEEDKARQGHIVYERAQNGEQNSKRKRSSAYKNKDTDTVSKETSLKERKRKTLHEQSESQQQQRATNADILIEQLDEREGDRSSSFQLSKFQESKRGSSYQVVDNDKSQLLEMEFDNNQSPLGPFQHRDNFQMPRFPIIEQKKFRRTSKLNGDIMASSIQQHRIGAIEITNSQQINQQWTPNQGPHRSPIKSMLLSQCNTSSNNLFHQQAETSSEAINGRYKLGLPKISGFTQFTDQQLNAKSGNMLKISGPGMPQHFATQASKATLQNSMSSQHQPKSMQTNLFSNGQYHIYNSQTPLPPQQMGVPSGSTNTLNKFQSYLQMQALNNQYPQLQQLQQYQQQQFQSNAPQHQLFHQQTFQNQGVLQVFPTSDGPSPLIQQQQTQFGYFPQGSNMNGFQQQLSPNLSGVPSPSPALTYQTHLHNHLESGLKVLFNKEKEKRGQSLSSAGGGNKTQSQRKYSKFSLNLEARALVRRKQESNEHMQIVNQFRNLYQHKQSFIKLQEIAQRTSSLSIYGQLDPDGFMSKTPKMNVRQDHSNPLIDVNPYKRENSASKNFQKSITSTNVLQVSQDFQQNVEANQMLMQKEMDQNLRGIDLSIEMTAQSAFKKANSIASSSSSSINGESNQSRQSRMKISDTESNYYSAKQFNDSSGAFVTPQTNSANLGFLTPSLTPPNVRSPSTKEVSSFFFKNQGSQVSNHLSSAGRNAESKSHSSGKGEMSQARAIQENSIGTGTFQMGTGGSGQRSQNYRPDDMETDDDEGTKLDFKLLEELKEQTYDIKDGSGTMIKINLRAAESDDGSSGNGSKGENYHRGNSDDSETKRNAQKNAYHSKITSTFSRQKSNTKVNGDGVNHHQSQKPTEIHKSDTLGVERITLRLDNDDEEEEKTTLQKKGPQLLGQMSFKNTTSTPKSVNRDSLRFQNLKVDTSKASNQTGSSMLAVPAGDKRKAGMQISSPIKLGKTLFHINNKAIMENAMSPMNAKDRGNLKNPSIITLGMPQSNRNKQKGVGAPKSPANKQGTFFDGSKTSEMSKCCGGGDTISGPKSQDEDSDDAGLVQHTEAGITEPESEVEEQAQKHEGQEQIQNTCLQRQVGWRAGEEEHHRRRS